MEITPWQSIQQGLGWTFQQTNSTCNIHQGSDFAELLQRTKLIIWDEAPMCHKFSFEALDKSLKDMMHNDRPFGGKVIVFCGDF